MSSESRRPSEPRLLRTIREDVRTVHADLRRKGFRRTFRQTLGELEEFYLSSERKQRLAGMGPVRRWFYFAGWLLKSLFLKLTPARRILLVVGLFLLATSFQFDVGGTRVSVTNAPGIGLACFLLVLLLELKDKLLVRDELEAGRAVQQALMPAGAPRIAGWDVHLVTRSANEVGGDLVDAMPVGAGRVALVLADVAGKGLPAALLTAKLQATWRALAPDSASLEDLGERINRILNRDSVPGRFSTFVYVEVTEDAGLVRLLNAGHMPPLVVRGASVEELPRGGLALGLTPAASYAEQRVDLAPGDLLLVYTDGVTEAMNAAGEFFGDERLRALLSQVAGQAAEQVTAGIEAAVDAFVGEAPTHDDISLLVMRRG